MGAELKTHQCRTCLEKERVLLLLIQHRTSSTCAREPSKGAELQRLCARVLDLCDGEAWGSIPRLSPAQKVIPINAARGNHISLVRGIR